MRVSLKNRIHPTLAKYNLSLEGEDSSSDIFTNGFSLMLEQKLKTLPAETRKCIHQELDLLEELQRQIGIMEERSP